MFWVQKSEKVERLNNKVELIDIERQSKGKGFSSINKNNYIHSKIGITSNKCVCEHAQKDIFFKLQSSPFVYFIHTHAHTCTHTHTHMHTHTCTHAHTHTHTCTYTHTHTRSITHYYNNFL